jgi:hypothetical protein
MDTICGIPIELWNTLPPSERLTRFRQTQPPPPPKAKPRARELTEAELQALEGLSWSERLTKARELQQVPSPAPEMP